MAEETPTSEPKGKGKKKGKKLSKGQRAAVFALAGVGLYLAYRWYQNRNSSAATSSTATPTSSTGTTAGVGGGYGSGGGYGGGFGGASTPPTDPNAPNAPAAPATTPVGTGAIISPSSSNIPGTTQVLSSATTPIGTKAITIAGQSFQTIAGFKDNSTGNTYLGVQNPAQATQLQRLGVTLVHNPNDPNGKGLFAVVPPGRTTPVTTQTAQGTTPYDYLPSQKVGAPIATGSSGQGAGVPTIDVKAAPVTKKGGGGTLVHGL